MFFFKCLTWSLLPPQTFEGNLLTEKNNFVIRTVDLSSSVHLSSSNHLLQSVFNIQKTIFTRTRTHDTFSGLWRLLLKYPRRNKQFWSWRRSSIVLSLQNTENIFTGTRTQDRFSGLWSVFLQNPRRNKRLCSWSCSSVVLSFRVVEIIP
jgi:hypothetical protein